MRTTITLDDDVAYLVKDEMRRTGKSMKETVNRLIKRGLTAPRERKKFVVKPFELEFPPGANIDKVSALIEFLEGPNHK